MDGLGLQASHHFCDVVLLKKANPGNASRPRIQAGASILDRVGNATESKHGDSSMTNFTQSQDRQDLPSGHPFFLQVGGRTRRS